MSIPPADRRSDDPTLSPHSSVHRRNPALIIAPRRIPHPGAACLAARAVARVRPRTRSWRTPGPEGSTLRAACAATRPAPCGETGMCGARHTHTRRQRHNDDVPSRRSNVPQPTPPPGQQSALRIAQAEAEAQLTERIALGRGLLSYEPPSLAELYGLRDEITQWRDYNRTWLDTNLAAKPPRNTGPRQPTGVPLWPQTTRRPS